MPSRRFSDPKRRELLDGMEEASNRLTEIYARWSDGVPAPLRAELRQAELPLLRLLIRAGRRGPMRPDSPIIAE